MLKNPVKRHVDAHMIATNQHLLTLIDQQVTIIANQEDLQRRLTALEARNIEVKNSMALLEGQYANHMGILQDVVRGRRKKVDPATS